MIELIDQSALNNADPSVPVIFGFRCDLCGEHFSATTRARAELHKCQHAKPAPPVETPAPTKRGRKPKAEAPAT